MVTIRPAVPDDFPFVLDATDRLADFDLPSWRSRADIVEAERRALKAFMAAGTPESMLLVAERDTGLAGSIFLETLTDYFTLEKHGHVGMLVVSADSQGTGVGRALMDAADAWAAGQGYAKLTLNVFETNVHARAVYDRLGYRPETMRYVKAIR